MHGELIRSEVAYSRLRGEYACVFRDGERLPKMVFQDALTCFSFFEYSLTLSQGFPMALQELSRKHLDVSVNYMTLKPDAVGYYKQQCGFFGLASFVVDVLPERFFPVMLRDDTADSFMVRGGDIGVYWGSSLKWGIYCDRESWDMCVLGTTAEIGNDLRECFGVLSPTVACDVLMSQNQHRAATAQEFVAQLRSEYK